MQEQVHRADRVVQEVLPHDRHGDQCGGDGQEEDRAVEALADSDVFDQYGEQEPDRHRGRHDEEHVTERVEKRVQEVFVEHERFIVRPAHPLEFGVPERIVREAHEHYDGDGDDKRERRQDPSG